MYTQIKSSLQFFYIWLKHFIGGIECKLKVSVKSNRKHFNKNKLRFIRYYGRLLSFRYSVIDTRSASNDRLLISCSDTSSHAVKEIKLIWTAWKKTWTGFRERKQTSKLSYLSQQWFVLSLTNTSEEWNLTTIRWKAISCLKKLPKKSSSGKRQIIHVDTLSVRFFDIKVSV